MTKDQATQFEHYSQINASLLLLICDKCEPYEDWFTYKRWRAQNEQVAKGQHGTHLTIFINVKEENENGETKQVKIPWSATVFCRHQLI